jgi:DnaK suppressor protein
MRNVTKISPGGTERRKTALKETLQEILASTGPREELAVERYADPVDQIQSETQRELASLQMEGRAQWAREIRAALERIGDGSYGACERCEGTIGEKRLDAVPWARMCVRCQAEVESANHRGHSIAA